MNTQIRTKRWDASEFLESREDIDAYLQVAFETGDPKQITKALSTAARAKGITNSENSNPTLITLTTVVDSLGYRLQIIPKNYVPTASPS